MISATFCAIIPLAPVVQVLPLERRSDRTSVFETGLTRARHEPAIGATKSTRLVGLRRSLARMNRYRHRSCAALASRTCPSRSAAAPRGRQRARATTTWHNARPARPSDSPHRYQFQADARPRREDARSTWGDLQL